MSPAWSARLVAASRSMVGSPTERFLGASDHRRLLISVRVVLLFLCIGLAAVSEIPARWVPLAVGLIAVACAASLPTPNPVVARWAPVVESAATTAVVVSQTPVNEPFLPYLFAPALAAGLNSGMATTIMASGASAFVLLARLASDFDGLSNARFVRTATQWLVLALAAGLLAAWVRRIPLAHQAEQAQQAEVNASYAAAYRLLSQLRLVSRQLAGGLDAVSLAQALLQAVGDRVPYDRGGVFVRSSGGRLVPLVLQPAYGDAAPGDGGATGGAEPGEVGWETALDDDSAFAEAWSTGEAVARPRGFDGEACTSVVLPLRVGVRSIGLVALESPVPVAELDLRGAMRLVEESTLRIETAMLFDEVRTIATAEERRRLAREIHDGIAQELASLGYSVDDLAARAGAGEELEEPLRALRRELTRIIGELRLSIFDLRSDVAPNVGLGAALSDHVRSVGAGSALTVHLILDEAPVRLRVESEAELLRIAQEAMTNARKHAEASNLWVTCRVDPPRALLRVEDDGTGLGRGRNDSFGLEIMRERAARLGGRLDVRPRPGGGTLVEVTVGSWDDLHDGGQTEGNHRVHDGALG